MVVGELDRVSVRVVGHADIADRRGHLCRRHGEASVGLGHGGGSVDVVPTAQLDPEVGERSQDGVRRLSEGVFSLEELGHDEQERALDVVAVAQPCAVAELVLPPSQKGERGVFGVPGDGVGQAVAEVRELR